MENNSKGFANIAILIIVLLAAAGVGYVVMTRQPRLRDNTLSPQPPYSLQGTPTPQSTPTPSGLTAEEIFARVPPSRYTAAYQKDRLSSGPTIYKSGANIRIDNHPAFPPGSRGYSFSGQGYLCERTDDIWHCGQCQDTSSIAQMNIAEYKGDAPNQYLKYEYRDTERIAGSDASCFVQGGLAGGNEEIVFSSWPQHCFLADAFLRLRIPTEFMALSSMASSFYEATAISFENIPADVFVLPAPAEERVASCISAG